MNVLLVTGSRSLRLARKAGIWCARYVWRGERFVEES